MTADIHSLSGAYVLHALAEPERSQFERHVRDCVSCALEVAELKETAARLADDVWSVPSPRMRAAVLARIADVRQERPAAKQERPATSRAPRTRRQTWRHRSLISLVTASVVGLATVTGFFIVREQREAEYRNKIEQVLTAPDAAIHSGQIAGGGRINVVVAPSIDAAVINVSNAPATAPDRAYQLWLIRDGQPFSAGVLPAGQGTGPTKYVSGVRGSQLVAVTVEPKAGSPGPTTPIVGQVPL